MTPEELRLWPVYDVYMIYYSKVATYINKIENENNEKLSKNPFSEKFLKKV